VRVEDIRKRRGIMKMVGYALVALCSLAAVNRVEAISGTQKVIQLLSDMEVKAKENKAKEAVDFSKFDQFCTDKMASSAKEVRMLPRAWRH